MEAAAVGVSFIPQIRLGSYILLLIMSALWIVPDLRMKRVYHNTKQNGAGGHNYGLKNAQRTAKLYDGLHPTMVNTSGGFRFHSLLKKLGAAVIREIRKRQPVYIYYVKLINREQLLNCHCQILKCSNICYCGQFSRL